VCLWFSWVPKNENFNWLYSPYVAEVERSGGGTEPWIESLRGYETTEEEKKAIRFS